MILEVLASSIVIMTIFISIYASMLPTIAQYQKRENYVSLEATYKTYFIRKIFMKDYDINKTINLNDNGYIVLYDGECNINDDLKNECNRYMNSLNVEKVILIGLISNTNYNDGDLADYISYLSDDDIYNSTYRLIVKTKDSKYATSQFLCLNGIYKLNIVNNFDYEINVDNDSSGDNYIIPANDEISVDVNYSDSLSFNYDALFNNVEVSNNIIIFDLNNKLVIGSDFNAS